AVAVNVASEIGEAVAVAGGTVVYASRFAELMTVPFAQLFGLIPNVASEDVHFAVAVDVGDRDPFAPKGRIDLILGERDLLGARGARRHEYRRQHAKREHLHPLM